MTVTLKYLESDKSETIEHVTKIDTPEPRSDRFYITSEKRFMRVDWKDVCLVMVKEDDGTPLRD